MPPVTMDQKEAIQYLADKVVELENKLRAQGGVINLLTSYLVERGVVDDEDFRTVLDAVENDEKLDLPPGVIEYFKEQLSYLRTNDERAKPSFIVIEGDKSE